MAADVRLYTLDCGHAEFRDFSVGSDTGHYDGRPARLADPCFLIRHPQGWMLWDAGMPATLPNAVTGGVEPQHMLERLGFRIGAGRPLEEQLQALGLTPDDIRYVAFSHLHFDHVGNAALFRRATWVLQRSELAWAQASPAPASVVPELLSTLPSVRQQLIDGDHDVFGDGSVRILRTPGHTPGSSVLMVSLQRSGPVLLSGDLYLTLEGRAHRHVPAINADRAATLASIERMEALARRRKARVIVQHAPEDYARLPKPPRYLD
ncbi:hypothetical protein AAW51_4988 [Caldimonas brevitalea]|uniref:Metallo-beta-lactamase domain-containing protein n=1 Tax=Caldimonas brevitalea TaxID=413882 RepID=A0A0G3BQH1_9BURK|nr:hypothetical protein AAW51_4988 [Caldimonas brevitalea]